MWVGAEGGRGVRACLPGLAGVPVEPRAAGGVRGGVPWGEACVCGCGWRVGWGCVHVCLEGRAYLSEHVLLGLSVVACLGVSCACEWVGAVGRSSACACVRVCLPGRVGPCVRSCPSGAHGGGRANRLAAAVTAAMPPPEA